ncbi:FadR/GntR family transcriptional regulator [Marinimicrobium sp. ABcell2]|uniref:FadR/GntR family transcriptional regulator n=1 Tax=Marinimicrobium sp. ABcell2 TaxID=3069751 RepID=UPI0027B7F639|nr:FadR/GntR family transcriptional regulator [Marinimicrobium sp. ABcell2]MDQ2077099.1 FadR/GntR family transcriptional regulator [Marinimicrobium sp. ABcell2]
MSKLNGGRNLTHQVTYTLGAAIVRGDYGVNEPFPTEAELCEQFDISRSVIREAVKMLTAKGLISSRPRQGIRVQPNSSWNMFDEDVLQWTLTSRPSLELLREFTELRIGLEPEAAILAARKQNSANISRIHDALRRMEAAERGLDDPLEADIAFHSSILLASENRFFMQLRNFIQTALRASIACTNQLKGVEVASESDHRAVYEAIVAGDQTRAHNAMLALLTEALALIDASLSARENTPDGVSATL